ncbi:MAG: PD-(D/E)XK nuclease family protein [Candidatus Scalindua sediminis]|nr:PD-(D/E)XK nuclease family protein [Candidatus Scalindua sediminis]
MQKYDGLKFKPLFHSEISSSFLVCEIFNNHKEIAKSFLNHFLNLNIRHVNISIVRERNYKGKGSIDLFLTFENNGIETHVLIEVKVHDYLSATKGQIRTYYEAALGELIEGDVYFIYLTQFNNNNRPNSSNIALPPTIQEFEDSQNDLGENKLTHVNWKEFHDFIRQFNDTFSIEEKLMISLQEKWITVQSIKDIEDNMIIVGERDILDYFDDISIGLEEALPFGKKQSKNKRLNYVIQLVRCSREELDKVFQVIKNYSESNKINRTLVKITEDLTLCAVKDFLSDLAQDENNWVLLNFYASLFDLINKTNYLMLYGTGTKGFSIKVNVSEKGNISLCTLWRNKTVEFSLKR